jgi:hypothetical protein
MHGNRCLRANRKSTFGERASRSDSCRLSIVNKYNDLGPYWSNMEQRKRKHGSYAVERYGRPVRARTADLYRVNAGISSTHNNLQGCWGLPST